MFHQQIENEIAFHLVPRSHSAAADCAYGVLGNIDIRMYSWTTMFTQPPNDNTSVKDILPKNGSLKVKNISSADRKQYCLSFDTPRPFSRVRLCIWRSWNIDFKMYSCTTMSTQPPNDKASVKDILRNNGSLKVTNISSADRKQHFLSFDTPQPFSRCRLCIWRSWKHRYQDVFLRDHVNAASKWQDFS